MILLLFPYLTTACLPRLQVEERFFKELVTRNKTAACKIRLQGRCLEFGVWRLGLMA